MARAKIELRSLAANSAKAVNTFKMVATVSPESAEIERDIGVAYGRMGKSLLTSTRRLHKSGVDKSIIEQKLKRADQIFHDAIDTLKQVVGLSPNVASYQFDLSLAYGNLAELVFRRAALIETSDLRAEYLNAFQLRDEQEKILARLVRLRTKDYRYHDSLANTRLNKIYLSKISFTNYTY